MRSPITVAALVLLGVLAVAATACADTVSVTLNQTVQGDLWTLALMTSQPTRGWAMGAEGGQGHVLGIGRYYLRGRQARLVPFVEAVAGWLQETALRGAESVSRRGQRAPMRGTLGVGGGIVLPLVQADRWSLETGYVVRIYSRDTVRLHAGVTVGF